MSVIFFHPGGRSGSVWNDCSLQISGGKTHIWVIYMKRKTISVNESNWQTSVHTNAYKHISVTIPRHRIVFFLPYDQISLVEVNTSMFIYWATSTADQDYQHLLQLSFNNPCLSIDNWKTLFKHCCYISVTNPRTLCSFSVIFLNERNHTPPNIQIHTGPSIPLTFRS